MRIPSALRRPVSMVLGEVLLAGLVLGTALASEAAEPFASTTGVKVLNLGLLDQRGLTRQFQTDVIGDRLAVVNFVYTSCKTSCPMTSAVFGQVQERLGDRLGQDVVLISLSLDPVTDRPDRLLATADLFHAKPGWTWLTGDKSTVDRVLHGLGVYLSNITDHPTMVLIGDGKTGKWVRLLGFPGPDDIITHLETFDVARGAAARQIASPAAAWNGPQQGAE